MRFIPFAQPDIGQEEIDSVVESLRSGWVTTGPKTHQFESDFSDFLGGDVHAVALNSATAGLHLGLEAFGVGPGDEVITTTHTFTATAEVIRYLGADPVFVDIDKETLCIDVRAVESAITENTKVIIPVHFGGLAADMPRLIEIAKKYHLKLMEDAAHALPTTSAGKLVGSLRSDVTVFSFYANKTMTTGEGGMLVTRDDSVASRVRTMRLHGINRDAFDRYISRAPSWYYEVVAPGYKYNMTDISASIGINQLEKVGRFQKIRKDISFSYFEALSDLPIMLPPGPPDGDVHAWHLFVIQLFDEAGVSRDEFIAKMFELGIGCSVHYIPLHLHPYWKSTYQLKPDMFPVSQQVYEHSVSLPIYSKMNIEDVRCVIDAVQKILQ